MSKLNPPILENTLPAFTRSVSGSTIRIPFQLSRAVGKSDFSKVRFIMKSVQSNKELFTRDCEPVLVNKSQYEINHKFSNSDDFIPAIGQYYKVQLAFIEKSTKDVGYYSDVGIIKCISHPNVYIKDQASNQKNSYEYIGVYSQEETKELKTDKTEKVYSYQFSLYDEEGNLLLTSGEKIHNTDNDTEPDQSWDSWTITKALEPNKIYQLGYKITTINGYCSEEVRYQIIEGETVDPNLHASLSVKNNFENGYNKVSLIGAKDNKYLNGSFVLMRTTSEDGYDSWQQICKFQLLNWNTNGTKEICKDYCLQQGYSYQYAIQAYNTSGLYSNRVVNVEGPVVCDFEDCFLSDGEKNLKIRYNPKVGSFKTTVLETKTNTLGGKYPFIFRNGNVEYKEFTISGLLSLMSDDDGDFFDRWTEEDTSCRRKTRSQDMDFSPAGTLLTGENYRREREYKMRVLEWLNNGKPKLFRSPAEGNFIVQLMNTTLTPNDTLGRMLHTFNTNACEIAEYNYQNLQKYGFTVESTVETRTLKIKQLDLNNVPSSMKNSSGEILIPSAYLASVTASPNVRFSYTLMRGTTIQNGNTNLTGTFVFPDEVLKESPLVALKLLSSSWGKSAKLIYGYYDEPDTSFSYIKSISITDQIVQESGLGIGKDNSTNILKKYQDVRLKIGNIHYLSAERKIIQNISYNSTTKKYMFDSVSELTVWNVGCLYKIKWDGKEGYIDGNNPPAAINANKHTYNAPSSLISLTQKELFYFELDDAKADLEGYQDTKNNREILGREVLTNLKGVKSIKAGKGIIMNIVYQEKEITYSIESTNTTIKQNKTDWQKSKTAYEKAIAKGDLEEIASTKNTMKKRYNTYVNNLNNALKKEMGDSEYAI